MTDYEGLLSNIPDFMVIFLIVISFGLLSYSVYGQENQTSQTYNLDALQILSHNSFTDSIGYFHVVGEVKNNSPTTTIFVKIVGTFYDTNNQVVGTQFTFANPSFIRSGAKAPFELILTSASVPVSQIDHYNLQASSE